MQESGIYRITNCRNGKSYIGSSINISERVASHLSLLRKGKHYNSSLQKEFSEYGEDVFECDVIEYVNDVTMLSEREQTWIDKAGINFLYNISSLVVRPSDEARTRLSLAKTGKSLSLATNLNAANGRKKPIKQIDPITGEVIAIYPSRKEAAQAIGLKNSARIGTSCQSNYLKSGGYRWEYVTSTQNQIKIYSKKPQTDKP